MGLSVYHEGQASMFLCMITFCVVLFSSYVFLLYETAPLSWKYRAFSLHVSYWATRFGRSFLMSRWQLDLNSMFTKVALMNYCLWGLFCAATAVSCLSNLQICGKFKPRHGTSRAFARVNLKSFKTWKNSRSDWVDCVSSISYTQEMSFKKIGWSLKIAQRCSISERNKQMMSKTETCFTKTNDKWCS